MTLSARRWVTGLAASAATVLAACGGETVARTGPLDGGPSSGDASTSSVVDASMGNGDTSLGTEAGQGAESGGGSGGVALEAGGSFDAGLPEGGGIEAGGPLSYDGGVLGNPFPCGPAVCTPPQVCCVSAGVPKCGPSGSCLVEVGCTPVTCPTGTTCCGNAGVGDNGGQGFTACEVGTTCTEGQQVCVPEAQDCPSGGYCYNGNVWNIAYCEGTDG